MDRSEVEGELDSGSAGCSVPLIPDSEHRPERENLSSTSETDENCLFQDAVSYPLRRTRIRRGQKQKLKSSSASNSSSDNTSLSLKTEISEFVKHPFRNWRRWKQSKTRKIRSLVKGKRPRRRKTATKHKQYSVPLEERRHRLFDKGIKFPFTPLKYLPLKLYFTYEQFVLGGFLNRVKKLKYERSLKQSLKNIEEDENLKNENFGIREYSYLDEDESLSPISDPGENLNEDEAEEEVKVVENSAFIVNCQVPSKKNWQRKKKSAHEEKLMWTDKG
ncbi:TATA box-binding protein-associated factor RNA polymerase I subunit D [Bufo gargarizans]|uniref:TATA box-binding protein-associated factor RNA polymerase I subunit D n=1 Tax=Bufo gargarizans TaxID=30331 RepID=UPI001CF30CF8|nr:TATA box-binding protein-associated factor RNA polymerase I subunit D [Bufo gargarizans]